MYSVKKKEEVIKMFKQNEDINTISLKSNVSKSTLYRWKKELDIRRKVKRLIINKKYEEAKAKANELTSITSQPIKLSILIKIARAQGDIEEEKRLLNRQLEIQPNNVIPIYSLIKIARKQGDIEEEKRLLNRIIEIEPNNVIAKVSLITIEKKEGNTEEKKRLLKIQLKENPDDIKAISNLIRIAKEEGDIEEEKRLLNRRQEIEPNNVKTISSLTRIAKEKGNIKEEKRLLKRQLEVNPNNLIAMYRLMKILKKQGNIEEENRLLNRIIENEKQIGDTDDIERQMMGETKETNEDNEVGKIRDKIYKSSNVLDELEEIKKDIDKLEDRTVAEIILAEIYSITGFGKRAYKSLQRYKKGQKELLSKDDLKCINKAIELAKNNRDSKVKLKWNVLHEEIGRRNSSNKKDNEHNGDGR